MTNGIVGNDVKDVVMYGISETIDSLFVPTKYLNGVNKSGTADDVNNVKVGIKTSDKSIESKYVYLMIDVPKAYIGRGYLCFKFFFDYE